MSKKEIPEKIEWTKEEQEKLKGIGRSIKERLDKMPLPTRSVFPKEINEILKIWDEEEVAGLSGLKGKANVYF